MALECIEVISEMREQIDIHKMYTFETNPHNRKYVHLYGYYPLKTHHLSDRCCSML